MTISNEKILVVNTTQQQQQQQQTLTKKENRPEQIQWDSFGRAQGPILYDMHCLKTVNLLLTRVGLVLIYPHTLPAPYTVLTMHLQ